MIQSRVSTQRFSAVRTAVPKRQEDELTEADLLSTLRDEDRLIDRVFHPVA